MRAASADQPCWSVDLPLFKRRMALSKPGKSLAGALWSSKWCNQTWGCSGSLHPSKSVKVSTVCSSGFRNARIGCPRLAKRSISAAWAASDGSLAW
eukprot:2095123-Amphidinium_carterae.1